MTTPTTPDVALPEAMVEAAARALAARTPLTLDYCRTILPDALAAALGVCDIQDDWGCRFEDGGFLWYGDEDTAKERVSYWAGSWLIRRLSIHTPPVEPVDTERAAT